MKKLISFSVVTCAMLAPVMANAAVTADLKLIGKIVPAACAPVFTGGATIDYGNIAASTLSPTEQTLLPEKTTKISVTCAAPVKFAIGLTDERRASAVTTLNTIAAYTADMKFGLGTAGNGAKIGAYSLQISNEVPDTGTTQRLFSDNGGSTWSVFGGALAVNRIIGFASSSTATAPGAHTSITFDVRVVAALDKTANLPITSQLNIDGLSTFEVKYL